ncbi:hypothetical protein [Streptomyces thermodiastaticus]|jgi:hypothetical protein|uniref:hypothetical protein n=1 Tax=Streptomyces thermodiastaticus TaxID=44061 RepID=UPI001679A571|nr:hypothetical protein [Streptomyces thermodiastaticus]MCE7551916.1 hypothetical protein [Streptomyces thermodiastaticus]GHF79227.1 hypothetical protein GCM10018787_29990 [Streptomyces thermodiastaticus]
MPLHIVTDPGHGGRWISLHTGAREWLWHRAAPERAQVAPGDAFVDAGGLEECLPTVRGTPDHGEVWSRRWTRDGGAERVHGDRFVLTRILRTTASGAVADYTLNAEPGYRFVWAAHALLDLTPQATLHLPHGARTRLFPEAAPLLDRPWPDGAPWVEGAWPAPLGLPLDRLGPDDGTAAGAVVDAARCCVHDGPDRLGLELEADGQPASVALWRNLGGFPADAPYRSIGVEPMLGRVFDLADAGAGDAARVPASGELRWRLTLTDGCRCPDAAGARQ